MPRTLALIAGIVVVLLGAWLLWPRAEKPAPVELGAAESLPARAVANEPEAVTPVRPRPSPAESDASATTTSTTAHLVVTCVARSKPQLLAGVRVLSDYADVPGGYGMTEPAHPSSGKPGEKLLTDAEGRATFEVEAGRALSVMADNLDDFVSRELAQVPALSPGETRAVRLEHDVVEKVHFCGLVVAREDGHPIEKAGVFVNDVLRTSTDAAGRFEIDYASQHTPSVRIQARGFGPVALGPGPGNEVAERARRVALERAASLVIALQVPPGQTSVRVTLRAPGYAISQDHSFASAFSLKELKWEAVADAEWVCTFEELPPSVRFVAEVIGSSGPLFRPAEPIVLAPGEKKRIEWDLRGCELVGHVYEENGKPAQGVNLWLSRGDGFRRYAIAYLARDVVGRATSAEDGSFRFGGVAPGTWILSPEPVTLRPGDVPGDAIAPVPLEVTIPAGESRITADVHIVRGLYIRGKLVAPDGTTGVQGVIWATTAAGEYLDASAEKDGVFALGPLARGTFTLTGRPRNTHASSPAVSVNAPAKDVVLLTRLGAEVSGKVIDRQSGAGVRSSILIGGEGESWTISSTRPDGTFRFDGLAAGRYTLFASTTAGQAGMLSDVMLSTGAPATGLEVVLDPGATLRIRYEGAGVGQARVRRDGATIGGDGVEGGSNMTTIVAPGHIAVSFRYPGREQPEVRELDIGKGEEREIVFKEPAGK